MSFVFTSEEAQPIACSVKQYLESKGWRVTVETAVDEDAPFRSTLLAKKGGLCICIEAQKKPNCDGSLTTLAYWSQNRRLYSELYIATDEAAVFTGKFFRQLDDASVGLIIVNDNGTIRVDREARNPALIVSPDPTLTYGTYKRKVLVCLQRFNAPNSVLKPGNPRKDGLRDMCELVEKITEEVIRHAARKGLTKKDESEVLVLNWSDRINYLAARTAYANTHTPLIDENLKIDLHSFRTARNLVDHPVRDKRQEARRQRQFAERMMMGPRLVAELAAITSRLRRRRTR